MCVQCSAKIENSPLMETLPMKKKDAGCCKYNLKDSRSTLAIVQARWTLEEIHKIQQIEMPGNWMTYVTVIWLSKSFPCLDSHRARCILFGDALHRCNWTPLSSVPLATQVAFQAEFNPGVDHQICGLWMHIAVIGTTKCKSMESWSN